MAFAEDFERWREDPMTRMVLESLRRASAEQKQQWIAASWGGEVVRGPEMERLLQELRTRADAYDALEGLSAADVAGYMEIDLDDDR